MNLRRTGWYWRGVGALGGVDPVNIVLMYKTLKEVENYIKRNKNNKVPYVSIRNFI